MKQNKWSRQKKSKKPAGLYSFNAPIIVSEKRYQKMPNSTFE